MEPEEPEELPLHCSSLSAGGTIISHRVTRGAAICPPPPPRGCRSWRGGGHVTTALRLPLQPRKNQELIYLWPLVNPD